MFNTVYALLWRPLNFRQSSRLLTVYFEDANGKVISGAPITGQQAAALADESTTLDCIGLVTNTAAVVLPDYAEGSQALELTTAQVNSDYFKALGLETLVGQTFSSEQDRGEDNGQVAVLSETAWRRYFHSDPSIVGRVFAYATGTDRRQLRIAGVVRGDATLPFTGDAALLFPIPWESAQVRSNGGDALYHVVLLPGSQVPLNRVSAQVQTVLMNTSGASGARTRYRADSLRAALVPVDTRLVRLLTGAGMLLLSVMCANLASLFLARAMAKRQDTSVRLALGASRRSLVFVNTLESALLCMIGIMCAFGVNGIAGRWVTAFVPALANVGSELLAPGLVLVLFGIGMAFGTSVIIAVPATVYGIREGLSGVASHLSETRVSGGGRGLLVLLALQIAIVLALLAVCFSMWRGFQSVMHANPGFNVDGVVTFRLSMSVPRAEVVRAAADASAVIASTPGAKKVAFSAEPVTGQSMGTMVSLRSSKFLPGDPVMEFRMVSAGYFETLRAQLTSGRAFTSQEVYRGDSVVVLNEEAALLLFGAQDPVGMKVHTGLLGLQNTVIGVVKDIRHEAVDKEAGPVIYMPYRALFPGRINYAVQTANPSQFESMLRNHVRLWDSGAIPSDYRNLSDIVAKQLESREIAGILMSGFAAVGLAISMVGLYGSAAAQVRKRKREIAIRIALGASRKKVLLVVLRQGVAAVACGILLGSVGSIVATHLLRHLLYGVQSSQIGALTAAAAVLAVCAIGACAKPAFEALHVDPAEALRTE
jgi:predicted permease